MNNTQQSKLLKSLTPLILLSGILSATSIAAQTPPSGVIPSQQNNNNLRSIQRSRSFFDSNRNSQRFFQQDNERLYFLPRQESESILQIDEEIKEQSEDKVEIRETNKK